jgi:hypothetical protein
MRTTEYYPRVLEDTSSDGERSSSEKMGLCSSVILFFFPRQGVTVAWILRRNHGLPRAWTYMVSDWTATGNSGLHAMGLIFLTVGGVLSGRERAERREAPRYPFVSKIE